MLDKGAMLSGRRPSIFDSEKVNVSAHKEKRRSLLGKPRRFSHLTIFIVRRACCPHLHQTLDRCVSIHPVGAHLTRGGVKWSNNPRVVSDNLHYDHYRQFNGACTA